MRQATISCPARRANATRRAHTLHLLPGGGICASAGGGRSGSAGGGRSRSAAGGGRSGSAGGGRSRPAAGGAIRLLAALLMAMLLRVPSIANSQTPDVTISDASLEARARATRLRARAYMELAEWSAAEEQLLRLIRRFPDDRYGLADLATVYRRQGDLPAAVQTYRRLLTLVPESAAYRSDLLYTLAEAERWPDVVDEFTAMQEVPAGNLRRLLSRALDQLGHTDKADQYYALELAENPRDASLLETMGGRMLGRGDYGLARVYLERAYELAPRRIPVIKGLAAAVREQDPEQYRRYLQIVLTLDAADVEAPYLLGEHLTATEPVAAELYFQEAVERFERLREPDRRQQTIAARSLARLGHTTRAMASLRQLMLAHPEDAEVRIELARLLLQTGHLEEAWSVLVPVETEPGAAWVRLDIARQQGDWTAVSDQLNLLIQADPANWSLRLDQAWAMSRAGRWEEAALVFDAMLRSPPTPAAGERAYLQRVNLRTSWGSSVGLTGGYTEQHGQSSRLLVPSLDWQMSRRFRARIRWHSGWYRRTAPATYDEHLGEADLELTYAPHPPWHVSLHLTGHTETLTRRPGTALSASMPLVRDAVLRLAAQANQRWTDPVAAAAYEGHYHRFQLQSSTPLPGRLYIQMQMAWRQLWVRENQRYGDEIRAGGYLSRTLLRFDYGSQHPLRSVSVALSGEERRTDTRAPARRLFQVQERSRSVSAHFSTNLQFGHRCHTSLSLFSGVDLERDQRLGDLYGASASLDVDLHDRLSIRGSAYMSSQSELEVRTGTYHQAQLSIIRYIW